MAPFVVQLLPFHAASAVLEFFYKEWNPANGLRQAQMLERLEDADDVNTCDLLRREIINLRSHAGESGISSLLDSIMDSTNLNQRLEIIPAIISRFQGKLTQEDKALYDALADRFKRHVETMDACAFETITELVKASDYPKATKR